MTRAILTIVVVVSVAAGMGCRGGRGGKAEVTNSSTTVGKELQDLEDARSKGLITESEYQKQRKEILK